MIDNEILNKVISEYKKEFPGRLSADGEGYKLVAVKCFQDNWDIDAEDFGAMFERATEKTENLLMSFRNYPRGMILEFCKIDPEAVREMFRELYDENIPLEKRLSDFKNGSERLFNRTTIDDWKHHFQRFNAMSTYLWLRYPDKYYIYKYGEFKAINNALKTGYTSKMGSFEQVEDSFAIYDQLAERISNDEELKNLIHADMTDEMYPDPEYRTVAIDLGFYISRIWSEKNDWWPSKEKYDPGLTADDWVNILSNRELMSVNSLEVLKRWKDFGGAASCVEIANKYGNTAQHYNMSVTQMCKNLVRAEIAKAIPWEDDPTKSTYFPIVFLIKHTEPGQLGDCVWKMRDEVMEALDRVNLDDIELYAKHEEADMQEELGDVNYYLLLANPKIYKLSTMKNGESVPYTVKNENGNPRKYVENYQNAKAGDVVFLYEATPVKRIVGLGRVKTPSDGEIIEFEKTETFSQPIDFDDFKDLPELAEMEFLKKRMGSFFKVTKDEYDVLMDLIREQNPIEARVEHDKYDRAQFLEDVFMNDGEYDKLEATLRYRKNIILCGAPGVGKTFAAKKLAYSMMGAKDESRIEFVQFHQNYSYEDFVLGYKPTEDGGFKLEEGVFYKFCRKAMSEPEENFFFIIDEINRGNLSKIFGELLMAIESDYRGMTVKLAYGDRELVVPKNLYIIGMMNTADRSLALMDYALRRRFGFFEMKPAFDDPTPKNWTAYQKGLNDELFDAVIEKIRELNRVIRDDELLGEGFCIGHSHFSNMKNVSPEEIQNIIDFSILPTLKEYWFDNKQKYEEWEGNLTGLFNDR